MASCGLRGVSRGGVMEQSIDIVGAIVQTTNVVTAVWPVFSGVRMVPHAGLKAFGAAYNQVALAR